MERVKNDRPKDSKFSLINIFREQNRPGLTERQYTRRKRHLITAQSTVTYFLYP